MRCSWLKRKNRGGENAKTSPVSTAAAALNPTRRPSTYAPSPHSTHDSSETTFTASTGFPVSHSTGAAKNALPIRFSEYASESRFG